MRTWILCLCVFISASAWADEGCEKRLKNYQDLLACVVEKSPEIENRQLEVETARAQIKAAGQWKNPELSAESFQGKIRGVEQTSTDISLGIPIEWGSKISARQAVAQGGADAAEARLSLARARVKAEAILKLHRLRQVLHEQEIAEEAIGTFTRLVEQYRKRPGLSPEQQTSLSVYQLAKGEYELQKSAAGDEVLAIETFFKLQMDLDLAKLKSYLPSSPQSWPSVKQEGGNLSSPSQKLLKADVDIARGELSAAQGEAWPTMMVGPSVQIQREGGQSNTIMGFNLSMPLPVFNLNGAGRATAAAGLKTAEAKARFGLKEQDLRKKELIEVYTQAVRSLSHGISHEEIEKRHHDLEKLFMRGVVPSALIIDAHRTSLDLEKTRHERELRALQSYLELATMADRLEDVSL
ncbi:MAG: TolC family protein [Bdellovibrionaceae bacterium]|nr:TolC family protein [Pseudobdellovibrionaceae bacterium]